MNKEDIRIGDVVRLAPVRVAAIDLGRNIQVEIGGGRVCTIPAHTVEEIVSRVETKDEIIERLEARVKELAKAPRRIEWAGGECPVDCAVVVWFKDGTWASDDAHAFCWEHSKPLVDQPDIIAYMELPE